MAVNIQDLITYFDQKWIEGSLVGSGPGKSGEHRLKAFRNMLNAAYNADTFGSAPGVIKQLEELLTLCDGTGGDFVEGPSVEELSQGIEYAVTTVSGGETPEWPPPATNEKLYGGTALNAKLYEWNGTNAWVEVASRAGGDAKYIFDMVVLNNKICRPLI